MKKLILLIALVVTIIAGAKAQVEIKALVGTNFSGMPGHEFADFKGNAGFQFGGGVLIGNKFYVEPGLQIGKMSNTITETTTEIEFDQNFVRIPVYAGYHLFGAEDKLFAMRVFAGPAVTIPGKIKKGETEDTFSKDNLSKSLWGVDAGLGFDILFLFVEVNYEHSFTDRFVDGTAGKHNSVYVNAGVHIDF